jgi:hypothetical protein
MLLLLLLVVVATANAFVILIAGFFAAAAAAAARVCFRCWALSWCGQGLRAEMASRSGMATTSEHGLSQL